MIVPSTRPRQQRRSAFTLLEVLVVVAILVILAGVSSIAVFKYLEQSYKDKAQLDMQALTTAFEGYMLKNGGEPPGSIQDLSQYMTQGQAALIDPWNKPYQYQMIETESGQRVQFFTVAPDGTQISWPKK